ncbi:chondroitinase-B domain-containing protein [Shewanella maritima]|uniref:chondroitinase-B domain-containing protein n=1 Tax=Shewanella maritima TaxID=2520507 RepID=UPI0037363AD8
MKLNKLSLFISAVFAVTTLSACDFYDKPGSGGEEPVDPPEPPVGELEPDAVFSGDIADLRSFIDNTTDVNEDGSLVIMLDNTVSFADMGTLVLDNELPVILIGGDADYDGQEGSEFGDAATITGGDTCIVISNDNMQLHNITFQDVVPTCKDSSVTTLINVGTSSSMGTEYDTVESKPAGVVLSQLTIDGENLASNGHDGDHTDWIMVRGEGTQIIHNLFANKPNEKGSIITVQGTSSSHKDVVISHNHFDKFAVGNTFSGTNDAFGIRLGTSSSSKTDYVTNTTISENLFTDVNASRRMIYVRTSGNTIEKNTFISSNGFVSLEAGVNNTADSNIMINDGAGDDSGKYEAGIRIISKGHTVTNNYVYNHSRSKTGNEVGAISVLDKEIDTLDKAPSTVANNTIVSAKQGFIFGKSGACTDDSVVHLNDNLVANGVDGVTSSDKGVRDDCLISTESTWSGNVFAVTDLTSNGNYDEVAGERDLLGNGEAELTESAEGSKLFLATAGGNVADKGASGLVILTEADVGPESAE